MADESHRAKAKSKWGKLINKDKNGHGNFKLNEDVVDFLKPSTEKYSGDGTRQWSSAPRIDVAIAKRWPEPGDVKRAAEGRGSNNSAQNTPPQGTYASGKPKRRKNLTVGFAKTAPEIIGEGGDEAEMPSQEISRAKAKNTRSFSDQRPPSSPSHNAMRNVQNAGRAETQTPRQSQDYALSPPRGEMYGRPTMPRAETSAGENSYYMNQRPIPREREPRQLRQPVPFAFTVEQEESPGRIKRSGTVFSDYSDDSRPATPDTGAPSLPSLPRLPDLVSSMLRSPPDASPPDKGSPVESNRLFVRKAQHRMNSEGRAFRRVSRQEWNADDLADLSNLSIVESPPKEAPSAQLMDILSRPAPGQEQQVQQQQEQSHAGRPSHERQQSAHVHQALHSLQQPTHDHQPGRKRGQSIPESPYITQFSHSLASSHSNASSDYPDYTDHQPIQASQPPAVPDQQRQSFPNHQPAATHQQYMQHQAPAHAHQQSMQEQAYPHARQQSMQDQSHSHARQQSIQRRPVHGRQQSIPDHQPTHSRPQSVHDNHSAPPPQHPSPNLQSIVESQPDILLSTPGEEGRNDSMRPMNSLIHDRASPSIIPQQPRSRSPSPRRAGQIEVPKIDTTFDSQARTSELMLSPDDNHGKPRSIADALSAATASTLSPTVAKSPSANFSRPGGFQGITPTPTGGPTTSYFTSHQNQTLSPVAASPSMSYDPHGPNSRSSSQASHYRPFSPSDSGRADSLEDLAFDDFNTRVAHMKGVFRLTAEREHPLSSVSPRSWLRAAVWWLHKGRAGLGQLVRNVPRGPDGEKRELLAQPHVDVAKAWWILTDMLDDGGSPVFGSPPNQDNLKRDSDVVRSHLRSLTLSMQRNSVMPPPQSLIQGQDTTIWIHYPRFAADVAALLRGSKTLMLDDDYHETDPLEALPAGDTRNVFLYNRMFVDVSINTDDVDTDRIVLPCVLSMLRSKTDWQPTVVISSQSDLVNIWIKPDTGGQNKGLTWRDVSWKARSHGMYVSLPRGFNMNIELQESDFRGLTNMIEYTRKTESSLAPLPDELLIHKARLSELQYNDSSNPHAFPKDRVRACTALVFEKTLTLREGTGARKLHRGYRLLLVTNPTNKTLSSVTHELRNDAPLLFENLGNPVANEAPAMMLRFQESKRSCKVLLVFHRPDERQHFHDVLNGVVQASHEMVAGKAALTCVSIEPAAASSAGSILTGGGALEMLRWEGVRVVNKPSERGDDAGHTVLSENLRMIATHESGSITDRLNLGKNRGKHC